MAEPTPSEIPTEPVVAAAPAAVPAPPVTAPVPPVAVVEAKAPDAPAPEATPEVPPPAAEVVYDLKVGKEAVNPALIQALSPIFKEAGMTVKQAQGLADAFEAHRVAMIPQIMQRDLDALRADPELGKLNFGRTQARVNDALAAFTTPQERAALTAMGIANNPSLVRMFHRIGASMQEPPQTDAGPQVREKLSTAAKLYGPKQPRAN